MFDNNHLQEVLIRYKQDFLDIEWTNEKYKWVAIKHFKDTWDINASDFSKMLEDSLSKTANLLASMNNFPARMITLFAQAAPEEVRAMFMDLFNEDKEIYERISAFKLRSNSLLQEYGNGAAQHFQRENAISVYLWLRYPDKYYIYKYGEVKKAAEELRFDYHFKKGAYADNIRNFYRFYDELNEELKKDYELKELLRKQITSSCYQDNELKTLTADLGFYISRYYSGTGEKKTPEDDDSFDESDEALYGEQWFPSLEDYSPGFSKEDWINILNNPNIIGPVWGGALAAFYGMGGQATCTQVAKKYNRKPFSISGNCTQLAKRIHRETGCPLSKRKNGQNRYWSILFLGKNAGPDVEGGFIWKLRPELYDALTDFEIMRFEWESATKEVPEVKNNIRYAKADFLEEVYMDEGKYDRLTAVLKKKKNIILQGAPGVGKTFTAKRLAYSMMGEKDDSRIQFIQFHQSYSYEDFMMGYKPVEDGFELRHGIFYRFCQKASEDPDRDYFFIIDEINRGNMSKIFGELLMLIETDYRGTEAALAYNGSLFSVPENLYIIGMMNTADRSLAMIDYALRRRFSFFEITPGFDSEGFLKYQNTLDNETFNELIERIKDLNNEIALDKSLGKGFCIGHSYFCGQDSCTEDWLHSVIDYDILPMLSEYWFDDATKLQRWENILNGVFQ